MCAYVQRIYFRIVFLEGLRGGHAGALRGGQAVCSVFVGHPHQRPPRDLDGLQRCCGRSPDRATRDPHRTGLCHRWARGASPGSGLAGRFAGVRPCGALRRGQALAGRFAGVSGALRRGQGRFAGVRPWGASPGSGLVFGFRAPAPQPTSAARPGRSTTTIHQVRTAQGYRGLRGVGGFAGSDSGFGIGKTKRGRTVYMDGSDSRRRLRGLRRRRSGARDEK